MKDKKPLLYKKLLYHFFVCLMAMRTSLGKKEHETLTLGKKATRAWKKSGKKNSHTNGRNNIHQISQHIS